MIQVLYSCSLCGVVDIPVDVPDRGENNDVWMYEVGRRCGLDHGTRSPKCRPTTLSEVKIPK